MHLLKCTVFSLVIGISLGGCENDETKPENLELLRAYIGVIELSLSDQITSGLPVDQSISLIFSSPLDPSTIDKSVVLKSNEQIKASDVNLNSSGTTLILYPKSALESNTTYEIEVSGQLRGINSASFVPRTITFKTALQGLEIFSIKVGAQDASTATRITGVPLNLEMSIEFSVPINKNSLQNATKLTGSGSQSLSYNYEDGDRRVSIITLGTLNDLSRYQFEISNALVGLQGEKFVGFSTALYTEASDVLKFPSIPNNDLLTLVQQKTFEYFYDFAHPTSGLARERNSSGDIVTSGGSGFGIMALVVAMERNFVTRQEGLVHMNKILTFLETSDRFHGAWSHWLNGSTGNVVPFSANDNGGDLVETSFLVQGLITFRQYLNAGIAEEQAMINRINSLWQAVEWDWYTKGGEDVLYWHWSPDKGWIMNHQIKGYNECLITYVLAASSPTHSIEKSVYTNGWASNGAIANGKTFYNITLPLGYDYGGPLFFTHYSFLGLDPRNLSDAYGNYWTQNVNHSKINHAHSVANPKKFVGYSDENWGLTASDNHVGYSAHSPTNDLGVISPTAALSSFPYTPEESMKALHFFYYKLGDRLWGPYGFYDAFNLTESWTANSYLAIDQGPIVVMIENHRTGLLWDLFMSAPEIQQGLQKLSFTY